jgi:hypothetical protein
LTGHKSGEPQAAVLEGKWKLILLGPQQRYLFDTDAPDGETRNLLAQHPAIADRLHVRLKAWDTTLRTPGLPVETHAQDQVFFDAHVEKKPAAKAPARQNAKKKKRAQ